MSKNIQMKYHDGTEWVELNPRTKAEITMINSTKSVVDEIEDIKSAVDDIPKITVSSEEPTEKEGLWFEEI